MLTLLAPSLFTLQCSSLVTLNGSPLPRQLTWAAMERLPSLGLARNIGVSNFGGALLMDLMTYANIPPAVLQVELHPYNQQRDLRDMCDAFGIAVTGYSTFGPSSWVELGVPTVQQVENLFTHPVITAAAQAHGKTPGQVVLRWATQQRLIVIPKSVKPERMVENLNSTDFDLTEEEMEAIGELDRKFRMGDAKAFDPRLAIFA